MNFDYPENMTKAQALLRRADKYKEKLLRDCYQIYAGQQSMTATADLIAQIILTLERSLPNKE